MIIFTENYRKIIEKPACFSTPNMASFHQPSMEDKTMNEKDIIRKTPEFKALRAEAREAIAAYEDGADFDFTISRLAAIGEKMTILLA